MKIIITGTTGYVGEGVMLACLDNPEIEKVLSVSRRPCGHTHPKLEEYIVPNFMELEPGDPKLQGYDAVFSLRSQSDHSDYRWKAQYGNLAGNLSLRVPQSRRKQKDRRNDLRIE